MPGVEALLDAEHDQIMAETDSAIARALLDIHRTSQRNMLWGVSVVIAVLGSAIGWGISIVLAALDNT